MTDTAPATSHKSALVLIALIAAQTSCSVAYHGLARWLGMNIADGAPVTAFNWTQLWTILVSAHFWVLVVIEIVSFALWMLILARIDLARAFPLTALSYGLIMAIGHFIFHEPIVLTQIAGSVLIIGGILLLASQKEAKI